MRAAERGFTLIELLVVLAILAAAAIVIVPNLVGSKSRADIAAAEQELRVALRGARSLAIASNRTIRVTMAEDGQGYAVDGDGRRFRAAGAFRADLVGFGPQHPPALSFFPSGGASGGRIVLTSGGDRRTLEVDAATGEVSLAR